MGALRERLRVDHFTLMATRAEILRREAHRVDDTGAWAAKTIDRVLPELASSRYAEHIEIEGRPIEEIVEQLRNRLS